MNRKVIVTLTAGILFLALSSAAAEYGDYYSDYGSDYFRLSVHGGYYILTQEPLTNLYGDNLIYGAEIGYKIHKNIEFAVALDRFSSSCDCLNNDLQDMEFTKLRYGAYWHFNPGNINPRIGVGFDYSWAKFDTVKDFRVDDSGLGFYVSAGLEIPVAPSILVGFEGIYSMVEIGYDTSAYQSGSSGSGGVYGDNNSYGNGISNNPEISGFSFTGFVKIHF
jgi:hypothetical protein